MQSFTAHDAKGRILWGGVISGKSDIHRQASPDLGVSIVRGRHDAATKWIEGGEVKDRPATGMPETHTLPRDTDWTVPDVPEGAEVVIDGHSAGTVDGDGLVLSFPEPGEYRVELRPPFPWRPAACEVTVQ